jgi:hypothetical protein
MAQHGYAREFDSDWERDDDRESSWRDRDERDREWRGTEHNRGFMIGDRNHDRDRDHDRGFFDRMGDRARRAFDDDDRNYRQSHDSRWDRGSNSSAWEGNRDWPQRDRGSSGYGRQQGSGAQGNWEEQRRNYSANPDDHYRSWRDRQMQALDRDYRDYCREREQQFHSDFDTWRSQRHSAREPLQAGMTQTGQSADPTGITQLNEDVDTPTTSADPMSEATAGTNTSDTTTATATTRGRR